MTGIVNVALTANTAGQNSSGFITAGQFFQLSQVVNHGEFGALYDQYRVLRVKVFWRWTITSTLTTAAGTNRLLNPPVLMHDPDYDSAAAISHTSFLEHSRTRFRTLRPGAVVSYSFTPAALTTVVAPGNAYRPVFRPWLDMTNRDVQHYGLHTGYNYPGTEEYGTVQTWVKYTFQCKGQR